MDLRTARRKAIEYGLTGPDWAFDIKTPVDQVQAIIGSDGGCGPGRAGDYLVPDTIWALNVKPACYVHDCRYHDADTKEKKYQADMELFTNIDRIIRLESANAFMRWLRRRRALKYLEAVDFGGGAFIKED